VKRVKPSSTEPYPLEPALDFLRGLWQLNQSLEKLSSRMEKRLGITAQQRMVMRCVGKYPGIGAAQLATLLHVDPGTMSAMLTRLEQRGLLERRTDPKDGRRHWLGLTAHGRSLDAPDARTVEGAAERLLARLPDSDIECFTRVLRELRLLLDDTA
jgi:DNA-binding MarR family transcriptional regulator